MKKTAAASLLNLTGANPTAVISIAAYITGTHASKVLTSNNTSIASGTLSKE